MSGSCAVMLSSNCPGPYSPWDWCTPMPLWSRFAQQLLGGPVDGQGAERAVGGPVVHRAELTGVGRGELELDFVARAHGQSRGGGARDLPFELKPSDASANPYLALAVVIAAGIAGVEDRLTPPDPVQQDPGTWTDAERAAAGIGLLPSTVDEQLAALAGNARISAVLGAELADAFRAVRESDAAWAAQRSPDEVVAGHRWLY
ncbi:hypothetical protein [Amycolatopsis tucumanensis]|uniref:hypothetical protein n=1 Tax=Amycolatopsis tucumanensis TaxID=401106 RepID=UPI0027DFE01E|nr:hypothetical protein [Amycolatopsis tucumanensis]